MRKRARFIICSIFMLSNTTGMAVLDPPQSTVPSPGYEERKKIYSELVQCETRALKEISLLKIRNKKQLDKQFQELKLRYKKEVRSKYKIDQEMQKKIEAEGAKNKWPAG